MVSSSILRALDDCMERFKTVTFFDYDNFLNIRFHHLTNKQKIKQTKRSVFVQSIDIAPNGPNKLSYSVSSCKVRSTEVI